MFNRLKVLVIWTSVVVLSLIATDIPRSLAQSVTLNGRHFFKLNGKWYAEGRSKTYEVQEDIITVKFKYDATSSQIEDYNSARGFTILRHNILGYYDIKIPITTDPIESVQQYQASGLVEIAHPNMYGTALGEPDDPLFLDP